MNRLLSVLVAGLAAGCMASDAPVELSERAQQRLDEALAGRSAGASVTCVPERDIRNTRTIGDGVMLFEGPGDVLWVNRPAGGCPTLAFGRAFRTQTPGSRLCRGDIVTVFDPVSGAEFAGCSLAEFTPYRRMN